MYELTLASYACTGKTSIQKGLYWHLKSYYQNKFRIYRLHEAVRNVLNNFDTIKSNPELNISNETLFEYRQQAIFSCYEYVYQFISQLKDESNVIIISDRCIIDTIVFYIVHKYDKAEEDFMIKLLKTEYKHLLQKCDEYINFNKQNKFYIFFEEPKEHILNECMKVSERKATIDKASFYNRFRKFENLYKLILEYFNVDDNNIIKINHPGHNSYVLYELLDVVTSKIELK